ncbi:Homeobox protein knotted-1-like 3 [Hibiscus syriacus]|uniref:Homeobox protein knotted-1-like 3 n=1 Tax=Hibiscus syriacus TaxID=106335 RepID=A0A6A2X820_HIBSY|nr:Homeobox protein knotted-1-like 3 [Hibiscus syriacus]
MAFHRNGQLSQDFPLHPFTEQQQQQAETTGPNWLNAAILRPQQPHPRNLTVTFPTLTSLTFILYYDRFRNHRRFPSTQLHALPFFFYASSPKPKRHYRRRRGGSSFRRRWIATLVDQLPRIDAHLAKSQHVVAKYSALSGASQGLVSDDKELDQFKTHYVLLLCSFKEQLQQHVRVHAMEAVMSCWEIWQSLQSLTGVSSGQGTGATMSDDDEDKVNSDANMFDGSLEGLDSMGFGPLVPTESERSSMERVRHELRQGYKEKIVDIREEILRKRRARKLPGDMTSVLKAWWQSNSKWPYPTVSTSLPSNASNKQLFEQI